MKTLLCNEKRPLYVGPGSLYYENFHYIMIKHLYIMVDLHYMLIQPHYIMYVSHYIMDYCVYIMLTTLRKLAHAIKTDFLALKIEIFSAEFF